MIKKVIVFGSTGGIGLAVAERFLRAGYIVVPANRDSIDFAEADSTKLVSDLLTDADPDVIVNCVGHFDPTNLETHQATFDINVGSNWSVIRHYMDFVTHKPVKIIMVGSSAYKSGRKDYILYAASKCALYNIWQGAGEYFKDSLVTVGLINPVKTRTKMINVPAGAVCLEPADVAAEILSMASTPDNQLVDMKYPEEN